MTVVLSITGSLFQVTSVLQFPGLPTPLWNFSIWWTNNSMERTGCVVVCWASGSDSWTTVPPHSRPAPAKLCSVQYLFYETFSYTGRKRKFQICCFLLFTNVSAQRHVLGGFKHTLWVVLRYIFGAAALPVSSPLGVRHRMSTKTTCYLC